MVTNVLHLCGRCGVADKEVEKRPDGYCQHNLAYQVQDPCIEALKRELAARDALIERCRNEMYAAACEERRPFVQLAKCLSIFIDGNQWCVLYGENLQDGVAGFGDSPELAAWNFDRAWCTRLGTKK